MVLRERDGARRGRGGRGGVSGSSGGGGVGGGPRQERADARGGRAAAERRVAVAVDRPSRGRGQLLPRLLGPESRDESALGPRGGRAVGALGERGRGGRGGVVAGRGGECGSLPGRAGAGVAPDDRSSSSSRGRGRGEGEGAVVAPEPVAAPPRARGEPEGPARGGQA